MLRSRRAKSVWLSCWWCSPEKWCSWKCLAGAQFFSQNKKGVGTFAVCAGAPAKAYSWEWGCLLSKQRSHAVPVTVSTQPLPWFPPRRTKEQEHGAVTIWQNQVLVTQNRASFFVNRGVWYRRASVAGKQGEWSACLGVQCALEFPALENHDGMMDNNYYGVSIVSLTVQNCS